MTIAPLTWSLIWVGTRGGGGVEPIPAAAILAYSCPMISPPSSWLSWTGLVTSSYLHFHPFWAFYKQQVGHGNQMPFLYIYLRSYVWPKYHGFQVNFHKKVLFSAILWTCLEDILWTKCLYAWLTSPTHGELELKRHPFFKMDQAVTWNNLHMSTFETVISLSWFVSQAFYGALFI